jgi:hypothetical protein
VTEESAWPQYPSAGAQDDLAKILYQAQVDLAKAENQRDALLVDKDWDAENELYKEFHVAIRSTAQTLAGAKQSNAELVQKAAATVITIYTGVLGLVFAVSSNALPLRGLVPAIFIGLAVALSTAYVAYLTSATVTNIQATDAARPSILAHTNAFVDWINERLDARAPLLRAAVLSLGVGLLLLPAPFIDVRDHAVSGPALPDWPSYPPVTAANADLAKVLYQAQVTEAATRRDLVLRSAAQPQPRTVSIFGADVELVEVGTWGLAVLFAVGIFKLSRRSRS